jgi:PAS domain S-box-containing protein
MRLRSILLTLAFIAFMSSLLAGYFFYSNVKLALSHEADQRAANKVAETTSRFTFFLGEQLKPVRTLAGLSEIQRLFVEQSPESIGKANAILDLFAVTLGADACYLMDYTGMTIASSNRLEPESFVGVSFAFRPYFQRALRGTYAIYMALGTASGVRGVYYSYPVLDALNRQAVGVAVIKASVKESEKEFTAFITGDETLLLTDPHGIVFISSRKDWLFRSLWSLSEQDKQSIGASQQFGDGPWEWLGFARSLADYKIRDRENQELSFYERPIEAFPGWSIVYLRPLPSVWSRILAPIQHLPGFLMAIFSLSVVATVLYLYQRASSEIVRRTKAEEALQESEQRFRKFYFQTPAMLYSLDANCRIVRVSDYWCKALGYGREEVIGREITDFMTPDSRTAAAECVIPKLIDSGACMDIAHQFVTKDGGSRDMLLSAVTEHRAGGKTLGSLCILVDVTELKRVEEKLQKATEELRARSQDLERQVGERAREISSILKHTPAVVYLKDIEGRYLLINSRYEDLFSVQSEEIRGKRDRDIFDPATAEQFQHNDRKVLETKEPLQIEEIVPQADGTHTYISVKFPLFDEEGRIIGVGGISTDITDLKTAQEKLRQLSNRLLTSQEHERAAIARELHDELGQALTALKMDAVWLEKNLVNHNADIMARRSHAMGELIDKTIDEVRNMAVRLRPGVLDDLGLIPALEWLVHDFEKRMAVSCTFRHHQVPDLDDATASAVYRISQEALTNVARHAEASHTGVSLALNGTNIILTVKDDGRGFDTDILGETEGLGLAGIRERASLINAKVQIESNADSGTRIEVQFPVEGGRS